MNRGAQLLGQVQDHAGYKYLEDLWRARLAEVQEKRDKAAQRGSETAWRYWAGVEKGFQLAVTLLPLTLAEMDSEIDNEQAEDRFAAIAQELKGEVP
jgi:hypothetical protein